MRVPLGQRFTRNSTKNWTEYTFLGIPYSGQMYDPRDPNGKDFHGTRFTPQTRLGWTEGRALPVYWEHGRGELGDEVIGRAYVEEETDDGRLIKVIIDRANRYHDMIAELDELGLLRSSGQSLGSLYSVDDEGILTKFHLGEFSLTVEPSNLEAAVVDRIRNVFGINLLEGNEMPQKKTLRNAPATEEQVVSEEVEVQEEAAEETSHAEEIEQIFAEADAQAAEVEAAELNVEAIRALVHEAVRAALSEILAPQLEDIRQAQRTLATETARRLQSTVAVMGAGEADSYRRSYQQQQQQSPRQFSPPAPAGSGLTPPPGRA